MAAGVLEGLLIVAIGFCSFVTGLVAAWWLRRRKQNWFHATAKIIDTVSAEGNPALYSPVIAWIDWAGQNRQSVLPLKSSFWNDQIGQPIEIDVDPNHPDKIHFPRQANPKYLILTALIMGGIAMMMAGYFIAADSSL